MYIGIDPGITGAVAILKKGRLIQVIDMPVEGKSTGKGQQTSAIAFVNALKGKSISKAYVEKVHAMPGQGVTSVFTFGRGLGVIEGVLASLGIPVVFVPPQTWKKEAKLVGKDKDVARTLACQLWPHMACNLTRKRDIGRADAALIGYYGHKMNRRH